jgi:hypothetical protein
LKGDIVGGFSVGASLLHRSTPGGSPANSLEGERASLEVEGNAEMTQYIEAKQSIGSQAIGQRGTENLNGGENLAVEGKRFEADAPGTGHAAGSEDRCALRRRV